MYFNNINNKYFYNCLKNNLYVDYILKQFIQKTLNYVFVQLAIFFFEKYFIEQITRFSFFKKVNSITLPKNELVYTIIIVTLNITLIIFLLPCELI